ncbi:MAG TPA: hypothetical protein VI111_08665, partial [Thermoleophilaceae bacterium]
VAAVFAADKISKVRELRMRAPRGGLTHADRVKLRHYRQSLVLLEPRLPCHPLVTTLRRELDALQQELNASGSPRGRFERPGRAGSGTPPPPPDRAAGPAI